MKPTAKYALQICLFLLCLSLSAVVGCPGSKKKGALCQGGTDCPQSDLCIGGECRALQACKVNSDCASGRCIQQVCGTEISCKSDAECAPDGSCINEVCVGIKKGTEIPQDCSTDADCRVKLKPEICEDAVCENGSCKKVNQTQGTSCDDTKYCTVDDVCDGAGKCEGKPRDCSADADTCNNVSCDEASRSCKKTPKPKDTACDDNDVCTDGDKCDSNGTCVGGPDPCVDENDACKKKATTTCDRTPDATTGKAYTCSYQELDCDDGDVCTTGDKCDKNGTCVGGPDPCVDESNPCKKKAATTCEKKPDTTTGKDFTCSYQELTCDDGNVCTTGDTCTTAGVCTGTDPCIVANDACKDTGKCVVGNTPGQFSCMYEIKSCDDGKHCTAGDMCDDSGNCVGGPNPCFVKDDTCKGDLSTITCSEATDTFTCGYGVKPCDSGGCTKGDLCQSDGTCAPGGVVAMVSGGGTHTCVLRVDGFLKCFGDNEYWQLGITGNTDDLGDDPNELGDKLGSLKVLGRILQVSAGYEHTCVLIDSGVVKCFGRNQHQQLGIGSKMNPAPIGSVDLGGEKAILVASGVSNSCAILESGKMKCWGYNAKRELGFSNDSDHFIGDSLDDMGKNLPTVCPGCDKDGNLLAKVTEIGLGYDHTCVLLDSGVVKCWGLAGSGQLLSGQDFNGASNEPDMTVFAYKDRWIAPLGPLKAIHLASGHYHNCVVLEGGSVKCWGYHGYGQVGLGKDTRMLNAQNQPERDDRIGTDDDEIGDKLKTIDLGTVDGTPAGAKIKVKQLALGKNHSCALTEQGDVKCWGDNQFGQLGYDDLEDRGDGCTGSRDLKTVVCTGSATDEMGNNLLRVNLSDADGTPRKAIQISAGDNHTCAVLDDYSLRCWGLNDNGQLGQGDLNNRGDRCPATVEETTLECKDNTTVVPLADEMGIFLTEVDLGKTSCNACQPDDLACQCGTDKTCLCQGDWKCLYCDNDPNCIIVKFSTATFNSQCATILNDEGDKTDLFLALRFSQLKALDDGCGTGDTKYVVTPTSITVVGSTVLGPRFSTLPRSMTLLFSGTNYTLEFVRDGGGPPLFSGQGPMSPRFLKLDAQNCRTPGTLSHSQFGGGIVSACATAQCSCAEVISITIQETRIFCEDKNDDGICDVVLGAPTVEGGLINDPTPLIKGTAPSGPLTVVVGGATYQTTSDGNWSIETQTAVPTSGTFALQQGDNEVVVSQSDTKGNVAMVKGTLNLDTIPPSPPTLTPLTTANRTPTLEGKAEVGTTLTVTVGGATYSITPDASGDWTLDTSVAVPTTGTLDLATAGEYKVNLKSTDEVGNNTGTDRTITIVDPG